MDGLPLLGEPLLLLDGLGWIWPDSGAARYRSGSRSRCRLRRDVAAGHRPEIQAPERTHRLRDRRLLESDLGLERLQLGVAQRVLERSEQRQRRHRKRGHGRNQQRADDPALQTERAASRSRSPPH